LVEKAKVQEGVPVHLGRGSSQGFFFQFCDVAEVAIIWKVIEPNLATCTNMEVGKNQNLSIFLATPTRASNKILAIGRKFFEIWRNWANFFMENPSYNWNWNSYFSSKDLAKIRQ
jgi:hypothetical protein